MKERKTILNPILKGFNPDPSIVRVGADYYIATSTFEWFPGVQIHTSKDLIHWKLIAHPLNTTELLDMKGNPDSGGIYAPCLSYNKGLFYLVYTNTRNVSGSFWDCSNYVTTAPQIEGPWSSPVYLHGSGIDPSLFHDDDGRKWLVSALLSHKKGPKLGFPQWEGILLQEYSPDEEKLVGERKLIYKGSGLGTTEGPHLYRRNGYYYLLTAEGGTFYNHAVTMARSQKLTGPYVTGPENPVLTARENCTLPLQRTGHGDLVETQTGEWYMVHLCGRPLPSRGRSVMGRETGIQRVTWTKDGWLKLEGKGHEPRLSVDGPLLAEHPWEKEPVRDNFDSQKLNIHFQTLRIPLGEEMMSLTERPGYLRLYGYESLSSKFCQSLVARRQQAFCYRAQTRVSFQPESFQQMAGLVCYYDTNNYIYLYITREEGLGRAVNLMINDLNQFSYPLDDGIAVEEEGEISLKAEVFYDMVQFYYSLDEEVWKPMDGYVEYSKLSDEYFKERKLERFTGAFVGLCCQDFTGAHIPADFEYFEYEEMG